jgi:hypothetical protein
MKSAATNAVLCRLLGILSAFSLVSLATSYSLAAEQPALAAEQPAEKTAAPAVAAQAIQSFATPQEAADTLISAAEKFDVGSLLKIFGTSGRDIVLTDEYPQDRQRALDFAAQAREKQSISIDPISKTRAFLLVGKEDWPFPVPIVKRGSRWQFDAAAGLEEIENRRIGRNELDAIEFCRGYVEAQYEYAFQPRDGYQVNQYAQHIISAPGKRDGLAWQNPDKTWGGPVGEETARAIKEGYDFEQGKATPFHGYFYKILKGQGPDAPLGEMDYVVKGLMIGGFALIAAPAEYDESGIMTFMVSQDGVVYQKDLGPDTLKEFQKIERFNPDRSWTPVVDDESESSAQNNSSVKTTGSN